MTKPPHTPLGLFVKVLFIAATASLFLTGCQKKDSATSLPVISQIPDFTLTNQNGAPVTIRDLHGTVWIADVIFTRCGGPCPEMTRKMSELQSALPRDCKFLTFTTDPEFDTPAVLKKYGEKFGADFSRWTYLSGDKKEIYKLGVEGLKLSALIENPDSKSIADLFIHSSYLVLVDKKGRARAVFESVGEGVDWDKVKAKIVSAANELADESDR